MIFIFFFFEVA